MTDFEQTPNGGTMWQQRGRPAAAGEPKDDDMQKQLELEV